MAGISRTKEGIGGKLLDTIRKPVAVSESQEGKEVRLLLLKFPIWSPWLDFSALPLPHCYANTHFTRDIFSHL